MDKTEKKVFDRKPLLQYGSEVFGESIPPNVISNFVNDGQTEYRNFTGASSMIYTLELMAVQQTLENILLPQCPHEFHEKFPIFFFFFWFSFFHFSLLLFSALARQLRSY